jgi:hypothetical protein
VNFAARSRRLADAAACLASAQNDQRSDDEDD